MKLTFLGAAHEVTGSCSLLEACGKKILVDCGLEQGGDIYENCEIPINPAEIDFLLLTHAHIDHSGKIPALVANGFSAPVYATAATMQLCDIMLRDSAHIQEFEANWRNRKAKRAGTTEYVPLYTVEDAQNAMKLFCPCDYDTEYALCENIKIRFTDAGHLLGSSSISVTCCENGDAKTIVFSGDLGNYGRPLIRDPGQPEAADYVVIESTYGDRLHGAHPDYTAQLAEIIQQTLDKGGNVVIPSFAIGRTQELLYWIRNIKAKGLIKGHDGFPVYVDSPLAVEATEIYSGSMQDYYDAETLELLKEGVNPIRFKDLRLTVTSDESKLINDDPTPKVILSASGMCEAGRIRHHLKHNLWRPECTILFVGYQSEGTLGRHLLSGAKTVKLFNEEISVKANIMQIEGSSGHADKNMLLSWLDGFTKKPSMVFVNHGDDLVCDAFAQTIEFKLGIPATAPFPGGEYDLKTGECLDPGNRVKKEKSKEKTARESTVFGRLVLAGQRLLTVIEHNKGGANKDLAKFRDQIIALCEKWDR